MEISSTELNPVLAQYNPWWRGEKIPDLPGWHRTAFNQLRMWTIEPPAPRAVLVSGARQVGKTTLLRQVIRSLLEQGVPPSNIIYITLDHPLIKLAGVDTVLTAWREKEVIADGPEYLFLDEAQFMSAWGTWIKHQVDFFKNRRIVFTGSASPLIEHDSESSVGRVHTIRLATLSFYEYLQLKKRSSVREYSNKFNDENIKNYKMSSWSNEGKEKLFEQWMNMLNTLTAKLSDLPQLSSLEELFTWNSKEFLRISELAAPYLAHFHEYLARGGFPQTAQVDSIAQAQTLLREDIVDKVLKRDMTALFGVRRIQELEHTFLYLCMHDGGPLDMEQLTKNLEIKKPTAKNFLNYLESTHLIYRLSRFGYGKEVLRGQEKIYLADAAIAPAVFLKGKSFLDDSDAYGRAVETTVFKHLYVHYPNTARFTYWKGKNKHEVDVIAEQSGQAIPFEIKQEATIDIRDFRGLLEFCRERNVKIAYIITKSLTDFGLCSQTVAPDTKIMKIPAVLLCYWLGANEVE